MASFPGISLSSDTAAAGIGAYSALARALEPLPPLPRAAPTSLQGGAAAPLTFVRKVKTSGYGAVKPYRPAWAVKAAARAGVEEGSAAPSAAAAEAHVAARYPALTPALVREDASLWGDGGVSAAARGVSVSATGRTLTSTAGGARVAGAPLSCAALAAGALGSLALSSCGGALVVGGSEGVLSAVLGAAGCRLGRVTRHDTGSAAASRGGPALLPAPLCWSASVYPGLVPRLAQVSASAAASSGLRGGVGGGGGGGGGASDTPSRLLLGLVEGGAALWAAGAGGAASQPLLTLRSPSGGSAAAAAAAAFPAPPSACCLCYMDRVVALAAGRRVYLFHYEVCSGEEAGGEDVGAAQRRGEARRYQPVAAWDLEEEGVQVTALSAMNDARSPYLVAACSDKSLRVWDLSASSGGGGSVGGGGGGGSSGGGGGGAQPPEVLRIPGAHSRAVHTLALPLASAHAQCPPASLDCVLTASAEGGGLVRLWDVRSAKCARQLAGGHVSRSLATGAALSPCATFVACGSEEKRAVVYDLRTSGVVERHAGASEAVTCVAWHPRRAALLAGSVDGGLRLYTE